VLAVVTLALGVGANAAVFGVVKSVLLDALPYEDADRLVHVYGRLVEGGDRTSLSAGAVRDLAEREQSFERMAAFYPITYEVIYRPRDGARVLMGGWIESGFLETLGVRPFVGRAFTEPEIAGDAFVLMLSYETWRSEFGLDPGVIGTTLQVDADSWEVIGVLPSDFVGPMGQADVWFGLDLAAGLADPVRSRTTHWYELVARLRPGVEVRSAERDLSAIAAELAREHADTDAGRTVTVLPMRASLAGDTRAPLLALMGSALLVLLIACANLAGALLARTITRRREFAVRVALGAGYGRLVRQLLTESTLLALAGALAGLLLASFGLALLRQLVLPALPAYADLSLDRGAILVTTFVALCTGIAVGIVPALAARRSNTQETLRKSTRGAGEGLRSRRLRGVLVSGQIALCLSLLVGAALLARSLLAMTSTPLGFDPDRVLTGSVKGPLPARDETRRQFFDRLEERALSLPGVTTVATTNALPGPALSRAALAIRDMPWPTEEGAPFLPFATVSDDYFRTMRIPVLDGRTFGPQDAMDSPRVLVVSETMARRYWPAGDAVGARIRLGPATNEPWAEIIAVVGDVRNDPARVLPEPMAYESSRQSLLRSSRIYLIRTTGDPLALTRPFRRELTELDATVPMNDVVILRSYLGDNLNVRKLPALLMTAFAALALVLVSVGVYALFSSMAVARQQEFGVRLALGSSPNAIARLILRQGVVWMLAGLAGGVIGIVVITRAMRELLFGVAPLDPISLGVAAAALLVVAAIALLIPVRRASRANPRAILR
jgi:predicted permease